MVRHSALDDTSSIILGFGDGRSDRLDPHSEQKTASLGFSCLHLGQILMLLFIECFYSFSPHSEQNTASSGFE